MKHVTGFPNLAGTRITAIALSRVQSRTSGVTAAEQINIRAVSIVKLQARWQSRIARYPFRRSDLGQRFKCAPGPITTDRHCRGNAERGLLASAAVAKHREVLSSVGFADAFDKEIARSAAPGGRLLKSAKSRSVPGQSVKTGSSLTAMRRLFGDVLR